jgi:2-dehydropantoate 2-reductase
VNDNKYPKIISEKNKPKKVLLMKICIIGAGAIGGFLAHKIASSGEDVSVIARGAHLQAILANGLMLVENSNKSVVHLKASDSANNFEKQDLIILCVKAHQIQGIVHDLKPLIGHQTLILTAQNGIPWWYFFKYGGEYEGLCLESVDPGGIIAKNLPIDQILGSVVYPAAQVMSPGIICHIEGKRLSLSELDNKKTDRALKIAEVLTRAGIKAPVVSDIRAEIWTKLWGNMSFNPISALSHASLEDICKFSPTRDLAKNMMQETQSIGEKLGVSFLVSIEKRILAAQSVGLHKTSMLQDIEAGRPTEADALLGSLIELGGIVGVTTPNIKVIYAVVSLLNQTIEQSKGIPKII